MENTFSPIRTFTFLGFVSSFGEPSLQKTKAGKDCLVFTNPISGEDTYVSISNKLPEVTEDYLMAEMGNLQICETQPDEETQARRAERAANGEPTQMESYVLCRKGEGTRRKLNINWRSLI